MHEILRPALPSGFRQRLVGEKVHKMARLLRSSSREEMYRSIVSSWTDPEALVVGGVDVDGSFEEALRDEQFDSFVDRAVLADQLTYLPDDQLAKVDRVSMAVGLEVRVPLVDHRLVEFAWSLPSDLKIRDRQGKWVLRQVLDRRIPRELMDRPKMGLSVPVAEWLRGPLRTWADCLLDEERLKREGVLAPRPIRCAWSALLQGRDDAALGLWAVLMFQAWHERWLT
jgi:asparagine synthase (glutamine-hydrolysing)